MKKLIQASTKYNVLLGIVVCILINSKLFSQQSNTMYFMYGVPQSNLINPAFQPGCNFYMGIPALQLGASFDNSAIVMKDAIWYDQGLDSVISFLHPDANLTDFLKNFKNTNFITSDISSYLISMGFRKNEWYYSVGIAEKFSSNFSYSSDFIDLVLEGNEDGDKFDLQGIGFSASSYMEISFGMSKKINNELSVGFRPKLLLGQANISMINKGTTLDTHLNYWDLDADVKIRGNIPFYTLPLSEGKFDFDNSDFDDDVSVSDAISNVLDNPGLALDFGVDYMAENQLYLSASITDLGFIKWKGNPYQMIYDNHYRFEGVEVLQNDSVDIWDAFSDTLDAQINYSPLYDSYTGFLNTKVYLGARYEVTPKFSLGVLSRSQLIRGGLREQLTVSANFYPSKSLSASFSYSIMNNSYNNFGFGGSFKLGPLNFYIISDIIPLQLATEESSGLPVIPYKSSGFNIRTGMNFMFGYKLKKDKDIPMIE